MLGFGCIEEDERRKFKNILLSSLIKGEDVHSVTKKWNEERELYDGMPKGESPERYTKVYFYDNALHFNHIHRNHPFSTDGWAMLEIIESLL